MQIKTTHRRFQSSIEKARRKCIRKFLYYFPKGYQGQKFQDWERNYKLSAHEAWQTQLNKAAFKKLLNEKDFFGIAKKALAIESKTNLLFSFEKMALRDAVRDPGSAEVFSKGLYKWIYDAGDMESK